mmetsp:Transcript_285/g.1201  ORF Transcript_285/g.1201 Transcript_285/m.1201 type:complete len:261 (+) Transcript_285:2879-3661(+)
MLLCELRLVSWVFMMKCLATQETPSPCMPLTYAFVCSAAKFGSSPEMLSTLRPPLKTRARSTLGPRIWFAPFLRNSFPIADAYFRMRSVSQAVEAASPEGQEVTVPTIRPSVVRKPAPASIAFVAGTPRRGTSRTVPAKKPSLGLYLSQLKPSPEVSRAFSSQVISLANLFEASAASAPYSCHHFFETASWTRPPSSASAELAAGRLIDLCAARAAAPAATRARPAAHLARRRVWRRLGATAAGLGAKRECSFSSLPSTC